jgi:hypothetical protein
MAVSGRHVPAGHHRDDDGAAHGGVGGERTDGGAPSTGAGLVEPVRSGAARRDAGVNGEGTAPAAHQLGGPRRSGERGALAAKARRHGEVTVNVAPLARYSA